MQWIGVLGLVAAVVFGYLTWRTNKRVSSVERVETVPVRELKALHKAASDAAGPGHFRQQVEIVGAARPHKNGALRSKLEERECVWHRHRITRKYEETYRDSDGNRKRRKKSQVVSDFSSSTAFFVEDDTGRAVVRPGDLVVDGAEKILDDFEPHQGGGRVRLGPITFEGGGGGTLGYQKEEWIVRAGVRLFVHGEAADENGRLAVAAPAEDGEYIISARSEAEIKKSENNKFLGFAIGTGVSAVAGVALLLAGLFF